MTSCGEKVLWGATGEPSWNHLIADVSKTCDRIGSRRQASWVPTDWPPSSHQSGPKWKFSSNSVAEKPLLKYVYNYGSFIDREKWFIEIDWIVSSFVDGFKPTGPTLKCHRMSHTHPYFALRPLKMEEHSLVPYIGVFHDFMSDAETEIFKSLAVERLERSAHGSKRYAFAVTSDKRTSKQLKNIFSFNFYSLRSNSFLFDRSWVEDGRHPVVDRISKRIGDAIGLDPSNVGSENYQVCTQYVYLSIMENI